LHTGLISVSHDLLKLPSPRQKFGFFQELSLSTRDDGRLLWFFLREKLHFPSSPRSRFTVYDPFSICRISVPLEMPRKPWPPTGKQRLRQWWTLRRRCPSPPEGPASFRLESVLGIGRLIQDSNEWTPFQKFFLGTFAAMRTGPSLFSQNMGIARINKRYYKGNGGCGAQDCPGLTSDLLSRLSSFEESLIDPHGKVDIFPFQPHLFEPLRIASDTQWTEWAWWQTKRKIFRRNEEPTAAILKSEPCTVTRRAS